MPRTKRKSHAWRAKRNKEYKRIIRQEQKNKNSSEPNMTTYNKNRDMQLDDSYDVQDEVSNGVYYTDVLEGEIAIVVMDLISVRLKVQFKERFGLLPPSYINAKVCAKERLKDEEIIRKGTRAVQIHYINGHYVTSCQVPPDVYVFDSLKYDERVSVVMPQLKLLYESVMDQTVRKSDVRYFVPQSQGYSVDQGAFAVANAICVLYNIVPSTILLIQDLLRLHIFDCLYARKFSMFPHLERGSNDHTSDAHQGWIIVRKRTNGVPEIQLYPPPTPLKTNAQGQVDFGVLTVTGPRGTYELQPKAFFSKAEPILGPKIQVQLQPNLMKPTSLSVEYDKKANFVVGEKLPEFTVKVLTEDDHPMASAKVSSLSLKLWKMDANVSSGPPSRALSFSPEAVKGSPGVFLFKERKMPESAAVHQIMITYYDGQYELFSNVITVHIKPAPPMQLLPVDNPGTPTVSNTKVASSRCVVRNLRLELRDCHGNPSGTGYNGKVKVEICGPEDVTEIPCFVGGGRTLEIPLNNGACFLNNLILQENAPGQDGQEYQLRCEVQCSLIPRNKAIPPLEIPFLFYNDVKKQSQMSQLSKQRDNLQKVINTYRSLFDTTDMLTKELETSVQEAVQEENRIKEELRKLRVSMQQLNSIENVGKMIENKKSEKEKYLQVKRRSCGLSQIPGGPEVIGKIGHLAEIEDRDIARVLSWHMSSDIDCVVTNTTKMAKEVYKNTNGKQQVLPIDSIFKKSLPDWRKPLPHIRYRSGWRPPGNPAYAREFLEFPQHKEECQIVFGMLLGDTLILDDLDSANAYRQEIVKFTHCPTILTREGDRIRSNGKFGGLMNKAVPFEKLRGAVFGEPLPTQYKETETLLEILQRLKVAMQKTQKSRAELKEQSSYIELPEMKNKKKECQEAEKQLRELEQKLGVTSMPYRSRTPQVVSPEALSPSKRARTSNRAPINGAESTPTPSPSIQFTPTRQSKRLASMTPTSEESRNKKPRRT